MQKRGNYLWTIVVQYVKDLQDSTVRVKSSPYMLISSVHHSAQCTQLILLQSSVCGGPSTVQHIIDTRLCGYRCGCGRLCERVPVCVSSKSPCQNLSWSMGKHPKTIVAWFHWAHLLTIGGYWGRLYVKPPLQRKAARRVYVQIIRIPLQEIDP